MKYYLPVRGSRQLTLVASLSYLVGSTDGQKRTDQTCSGDQATEPTVLSEPILSAIQAPMAAALATQWSSAGVGHALQEKPSTAGK